MYQCPNIAQNGMSGVPCVWLSSGSAGHTMPRAAREDEVDMSWSGLRGPPVWPDRHLMTLCGPPCTHVQEFDRGEQDEAMAMHDWLLVTPREVKNHVSCNQLV